MGPISFEVPLYVNEMVRINGIPLRRLHRSSGVDSVAWRDQQLRREYFEAVDNFSRSGAEGGREARIGWDGHASPTVSGPKWSDHRIKRK